MQIKYIDLNVNTQSDAAVSESMFRFWRYQYEQALMQYNSSKSKLEGAYFANKQAEDEFQKSDEMTYFGVQHPYTLQQINNLKEDIKKFEQNYNEAKSLYDYFMRYVFNNLHS